MDEIDTITDSLAAMMKVDSRGVQGMLQDLVSVDAIKDLFNYIFFLLPAKKVNLGDRWGNDFVLTTKAPVKVSNVFTLKNDMKDSALVEIQSALSGIAGEGGKIYLKGKQQGFAEVDPDSGIPYALHTNTESIYTTDIDESVHKIKLTVIIISKD